MYVTSLSTMTIVVTDLSGPLGVVCMESYQIFFLSVGTTAIELNKLEM